jgi:hypothetical protein
MGSFVAGAFLATGLSALALGQVETDRAVAERILAEFVSPSRPEAPATAVGKDGGGAPGSGPSAGAGGEGRGAGADGGARQGQAVGSSGAGSALTREPVEAAQHALERASGARLAGDVRQAELLEGLAREWAETARDLVRAAKTEADATQLEGRAAQAVLRAERQRALLEEAIARRGRAEAELQRLSVDAGAPPPAPTSAPTRPKPPPAGRPGPLPKGAR